MGHICGLLSENMQYRISMYPHQVLYKKSRPQFFQDVFIWIGAVFDGLSENRIGFVGTHNLDMVLVKILEKNHLRENWIFSSANLKSIRSDS